MATQGIKLKTAAPNPLAAEFEPKKEESLGQGIGKSAMERLDETDARVAEPKLLTEFHPFPRMPSELRLKIWKFHMSDARIVELKYCKKIFRPISPTPAPASLHVCRESRTEALKLYALLHNPDYFTPRIFINPQIDTLYFSEKRGGDFNEVFTWGDDTYFNYFKIMTENIHTSVLTNLRRIALIDESYLRNLEWDDEREDVFNLTKFTNLEIAAMAIDFDTELGLSHPDYDDDEVLHSCNLCGCPFIKEVLLELNKDHIYFEQLKQGLRGMFTNFGKKLPSWKVPKTKTMVLAEKKRDVKKGSFEFHFKKPELILGGKPRIPEWANISEGGKRVIRIECPRPRSGSF